MSHRSGCGSALPVLRKLFLAACGLLFAGVAVFAEPASLSYLKLPLSFEPNVGQADSRFQFVSRGGGYTLFLNPDVATLKLRGSNADTRAQVRMAIVGGNPAAEGHGADLLSGKSNYMLGDDPAEWRTNIANFGRVEYRGVYPGIDLVYYGNQRRLEYDFVVAPGADPNAIRLKFEGAENIHIDGDGNLMLDIAGGTVSMQSPEIYQELNGTRQSVPGKYVITADREVRFELGAYDTDRTLVIDPILLFSTYLGGFAGDDLAYGVAADNQGNGYVVGAASTMDFPTRNPIQAGPAGNTDVFITKFSSTGNLVYSTYLGGSAEDQATAVAVDATGSAYVAGFTSSMNFPTVKPYQSANRGGDSDVFITKINPAGTALVYSTYLGGSLAERGLGIAVDRVDSSVYVTGYTDSANFPVANAIQPALSAFADAFVSKLNFADPVLTLTYSTYLGGSAVDQGSGITVDAIGNAYIVGTTDSPDFPNVAAKAPPAFPYAGNVDAFITKLNASGNVLLYWTFLGGSAFDQGNGIAVDSTFSAHVVGRTNSVDFPSTAAAVQPARAGSADAFVSKLDVAGSGLLYSTYLGGSGFDQGLGISVDGTGAAYVTGSTGSANFPTFNPIQQVNNTLGDAFVTALNLTGSSFVYSTYLGGDGGDIGTSISVYTPPPPFMPQAFVTGYTDSTNFPTVSAFQSTKGPGFKAFVSNLSTPIPPPVVTSLTFNPNPVVGGSASTGTVTLATPAPPGDATISLVSSNPSVVSVPASFVIAAGSSSGTFTANTTTVTSPTAVTVRASSGTSFDDEVLQVVPVPPAPPAIVAVEFNPAAVTGGETSTGTVVLSAPAPAGTVITLSSNSIHVTVPPTVVVPTGATRVSFTASTTPPASGSVDAVITATLGSSSRTGILRVNARSTPPPTPVFLPFSKFTADVTIHLGKGTKDDSFFVKGEFKLGPGNNGINPVTEAVSLKVGPYSVVLPPGSFRKLGKHDDDDHCGKPHYVFIGVVDGSLLHVHLKQDKNGMWDYHVLAFRTEMSTVTNPVTVQLVIGNDGGITTDLAKIHKTGWHGKDDDDDDDHHDRDDHHDGKHDHDDCNDRRHEHGRKHDGRDHDKYDHHEGKHEHDDCNDRRHSHGDKHDRDDD